jgi:hypothetical protein
LFPGEGYAVSGGARRRVEYARIMRQSFGIRLALTLPFVVLFAVNAWHHQFWGDELHAWGIVTYSSSLSELFGNMHYEGHPALWNLLLWFPSRMSPSLDGIRLVAFAVGIGIIVTIGFASPFTVLEKILLLLNYFIVFEYTVMARNYGIGLLLAMLYAMVRRQAPDRALLIGLLLGLLANTNIYAWFLACLLALEYLWSQRAELRNRIIPTLARLAPGALICCALIVFAAWTVIPPDNLNHRLGSSTFDVMSRLPVAVLRALVAPFVPIDLSFPASFTKVGNWYEHGKRVVAMAALLPAVLFAVWTVLRLDKGLALVFAGAALFASVFPLVVQPAQIRHLGIVFVAFVTIWWLVRDRLPARCWPVLGLLVVGAIGGGTAIAGQWLRPFTVIPLAADWVRNNGHPDCMMIGMDDWVAEKMAITLDRPIYSLGCSRDMHFAQDRADCLKNDSDQGPIRVAALAKRTGARCFLMPENRLDDDTLALFADHGLRINELVHFSGGELDQQISIYLIESQQP